MSGNHNGEDTRFKPGQSGNPEGRRRLSLGPARGA